MRRQVVAQRRNPLSSTVVTFLVLVVVTGCLYWAKPVLVPLALSILLTFLLSPLVVWLQHRGLPKGLAVGLSTGGCCLLLIGFFWIVTAQLVSLANQLPRYQEKLAERISAVREQGEESIFSKLQSFAERITVAATSAPDAAERFEPPQRVEVVNDETGWDPFPYVAAIVPMIEPLAAAGLILVIVIYMLLNREDVRNRLLRLLGSGHLTMTTRALDDAGHRISRFLLVQFLLNAAFGVLTGLGLYFLQLPYAILWGFLAAFLRYIPIIGPWILAVFPLTFSLLISDGWGQPLAILSMFVVYELVSNLILEPWLYGQSIGVSQAGLLVAIAFWTWLWGAMGLLMAAPLTVCLVVLGKYVPQLKFFDIILGDEPALTADVNLYQRLLARDADEAAEIVEQQLATRPPAQVYDEVLVPALVFAKRDLWNERIEEPEAEEIWTTIREIAEEYDPTAATPEIAADAEAPRRLKILACAARDSADEAALSIFSRLLDPLVVDTEIISNQRMVGEVVHQVDEERPAIICVAALPPGGLAHTRLYCKRLRQHYPHLKIIVARWGLRPSELEENKRQLQAAGADHIGTTMEETSRHLVQLAQSLRSLKTTEDWSKPADRARTRSTPPVAGHANL
jgi:predicted PurR-regulated permease PerM